MVRHEGTVGPSAEGSRLALDRWRSRLSWRGVVRTLSAAAWLLSAVSPAFGQASSRQCPQTSERTDEPGPTCSTGSEKLGRLPQRPVFRHLDTYPIRAAAEGDKGPGGIVVESLGKI